MRKANRKLLLNIPLILCSVSIPVLSQASDLPLKGPLAFEMLDKDSNGFISANEFITTHNARRKMRMEANMRGSMRDHSPGFGYFDTDMDNQLSKDELTSGRKAWKKRMQKKRTDMKKGRGKKSAGMGVRRGRNMPSFEFFDMNANGSLEKEEFYDARAKRMYKRAEQGFPMRNAAKAPAFESIDTNNDGVISPDEFYAHQKLHRQGK